MPITTESKRELIAALNDYIDAKAVYEKTVKKIAALEQKKKTIEQDSVKGSMEDFPYTGKNFHLSGIIYTPEDAAALKEEEEILRETALRTGETKRKVERYMIRIPARMQRIIECKLFERESWDTVAARLGGTRTGDAIRKEFDNFIGKGIEI